MTLNYVDVEKSPIVYLWWSFDTLPHFEEIFGRGVLKLEVDLKLSLGSPEVVISIQGWWRQVVLQLHSWSNI